MNDRSDSLQAGPALPARASPWWRFSIREMLLLTTAVGAMVAVFVAYYRQSVPLVKSRLYEEFGTTEYLRAVGAPLHSRPPQLLVTNGTTHTHEGSDANCRVSERTLGLPHQSRPEFIRKLHQDAVGLIKTDHRSLVGELRNGQTKDDLQGFTYRYRGGKTRGVLHVERVDLSDEEMHLSIVIYEHADER